MRNDKSSQPLRNPKEGHLIIHYYNHFIKHQPLDNMSIFEHNTSCIDGKSRWFIAFREHLVGVRMQQTPLKYLLEQSPELVQQY
jgi:hypothetical protein